MAVNNKLQTFERNKYMLELRKRGLSYLKIGQMVGLGPRYVHKTLMKMLRDELHEPIEAVRQMEVARLDSILNALWNHRGQPEYVDRILRVMERRSRLLGLDVPVKVEADVNVRLFRVVYDDKPPEIIDVEPIELLPEGQ